LKIQAKIGREWAACLEPGDKVAAAVVIAPKMNRMAVMAAR